NVPGLEFGEWHAAEAVRHDTEVAPIVARLRLPHLRGLVVRQEDVTDGAGEGNRGGAAFAGSGPRPAQGLGERRRRSLPPLDEGPDRTGERLERGAVLRAIRQPGDIRSMGRLPVGVVRAPAEPEISLRVSVN